MSKFTANDNVFSPNVVPGDFNSGRYLLYRKGPKGFGGGTVLVSATPSGKPFRVTWKRDVCGLGCACGAALVNITKTARKELRRAAIIDELSEIVKEAS